MLVNVCLYIESYATNMNLFVFVTSPAVVSRCLTLLKGHLLRYVLQLSQYLMCELSLMFFFCFFVFISNYP